ncbi:hypothetical protein JZ751_020121 [Albula glossodonta]|uniref:Calcium signal-modulating cyclophilin ligand n=1 Tax=Albula glossodonta TaxID=121402 RepID=A0A8T2NTS9_9TELE|nr:hypothetical protein JZ751_020121 [Albula glossodonta]
MEVVGEGQNASEEKCSLSASKRRAEIRRRKLLMNSEDRMNRIMGFNGSKKDTGDAEVDRNALDSTVHLDLEKPGALPSSVSPARLSPLCSDAGRVERKGSPLRESRGASGGYTEGTGESEAKGQGLRGELQIEETGGLQQYLSQFDEAMRLREQLASERPAQESSSDSEELDAFRLFRLIGSVVLAIVVRVFVCNYLSIFAPFLTLQMMYMGTYKYFPKGERRMKTTMLTAALLLSRIPAELISRSMDTYSRMGDVFTDLCVYFFTFVVCHETLALLGSEGP